MSRNKKKQYQTLTATQCHEGSILLLKNAKNHREVAALADKGGHHSIAISHIILALEELAKAAILRIKSSDEKITITNIDIYFDAHPAKHKAIKRFYKTTFENMFSQLLDHISSKVNPDTVDGKMAIAIVIIISIMAYNLHAIKKEKKIDLDEMRNRGFYVDYDFKEQKWKTPSSSISKDQFTKLDFFSAKVFTSIEIILLNETLKQEDINKFLKTLKDPHIIIPEEIKKDIESLKS